MILSKKSKDELRNEIVEKLKKVPKGQMIQLDKELLENLLFEVVTIDKEKNVKVKLPIWSGEFLQKLNLSQVDFTNVSWAILDPDDNNDYKIDFPNIVISSQNVFETIEKMRDEKIRERIRFSKKFAVDYSGTNASIDLKKSFENIYGGYIEIRKCNFANMDFSNQDLKSIKELRLIDSNISDTKLTIPKRLKIQGYQSSLDNIDLSSRTIEAEKYLKGDTYSLAFCSLRNTKININPNLSTDIKYVVKNEILKTVMNEYWVGCYINGKKVLSYEEKQKIATEKRKEYEEMKSHLFYSVLKNIEEQITKKKR